jgi:hypothetical protein
MKALWQSVRFRQVLEEVWKYSPVAHGTHYYPLTTINYALQVDVFMHWLVEGWK